ncbi:SEL1-like repeat protein, partial [Enterobacter hormaechei]|nr:sel1 repeat family protein [Enterobacter hormaechei]
MKRINYKMLLILLLLSGNNTAYASEKISALEEDASRGDVEAQTSLGIIYLNGDGVEKDYSKAKLWLEKAAGHNNQNALYSLGVIYSFGYG